MAKGTPSRRAHDRPVTPWVRASRWALAVSALLLLSRLVWQVQSGEVAHDGSPAWSPDSRRLVFAAEHDGQSDIYVMDATGGDRRRLTSTPAEENAPAFSPDGRHIAFESTRDGNSEIYVMDAAGGDVRRLTSGGTEDRSPAWSPDGERIVFLSDREHPKRFDLYTMRADGSDVQRLTSDRTIWSPQYSPDGRMLAIQAGGDIELVPAAGGPGKRLTYAPANGMSPAWSPDGTRLVFATTRHDGKPEIFTMNADGTNQQVAVSMPAGSAIDPRWSPDGSRIAFVYIPDGKPGADEALSPYAIYTLELATQKVTRVSP